MLRRMCEPVTTFDTDLRTLVNDMADTMKAFPGTVGLAACQVGVPIRLLLVDAGASTNFGENLHVVINPEITDTSRNKWMREGCLSFPEYLANVKRAQRIVTQFSDMYGEQKQLESTGLEAVAIQHERDHLDGILMIDRITSLKTDWQRRLSQPQVPTP